MYMMHLGLCGIELFCVLLYMNIRMQMICKVFVIYNGSKCLGVFSPAVPWDGLRLSLLATTNTLGSTTVNINLPGAFQQQQSINLNKSKLSKIIFHCKLSYICDGWSRCDAWTVCLNQGGIRSRLFSGHLWCNTHICHSHVTHISLFVPT